ncbi:MAG: cobyric acid synthase [Pelosinus sp.]|nr:cobyric acid synthase [Pelosinus sp.]
MGKTIMLQGTSSHVGKSILTTALCRILWQDGQSVAPFKAQNMALNSYVTRTGAEMGRAQVAQAEAAGLEPMVEMNPVLLKPTGNACSQVVLMGKPIGNMTAQQYHQGYSLTALDTVKECLDKLMHEYDAVVIEGAGSPAEVNLKANDIVNMRVAKMINAPVLLVADIDRGGALAAVVGTLELLEEDERALVAGIIINKFRGDIKLLQPALEFLEEKTGKPVLGVIPHLDNLGIDDEDSVSLEDKKTMQKQNFDLEIAVLRTPKISNFTDFDALAGEADVMVRYVQPGEAIGKPDLVILPGSKNTVADLCYLREEGYEKELKQLVKEGTPLIGICGGYQMLGMEILDPEHTESAEDQITGLGLLPTRTTFVANKVTHQVIAASKSNSFLGINYSEDMLKGYEIHMGRTEFLADVDYAFTITERSGEKIRTYDGVVSKNGQIMGTYIHGIFDNDALRRAILNALRERKGLNPLASTRSMAAEKQASFDRLAKVVRQNLRMDLLYKIIGREV